MASPTGPRATPPAEEFSSADVIRRYFYRPGIELLTKQVRLQRAVLDAIAEEHLQAGDRIPPEMDLSRVIGVSLGTTQRALGALARQGLIERRPGKGTFVAENRVPEDELWHFRFMLKPDDSQYLPIFSKVLDADLISGTGPWSACLGNDPAGYVRITRLIDVGQSQYCLSRIYLQATRFGGMVDGTMPGIQLSNIKLMLRRNFGVTNTFVEQTIQFTKLSKDQAAVLEAKAGDAAILLTVYGYEADGTVISYHEFVIPPNDMILDMSYSGAPLKLGTLAKGIGKV